MRAFFLAVLVGISTSASGAEPVVLSSPATKVTLVELFTSQGCSSCPPADKWISALRTDPRLWQQMIPVAFHVDYWDYIGWKDEFADPRFAKRHRQFARERRVRSVYTPGLVVAGNEWRGWFRRPVLTLDDPAQVGPLRLEINDKHVDVRFEPRTIGQNELEAHVALLGFDIKTVVRAGENEGRTLHHDFVVLGYERAQLVVADGKFVARIARPNSHHNAPRLAMAAWVNARGDQRPLQAVGGWIPM
jgi:hypothetical protein